MVGAARSVAWPMDADGHNVEHDGTWTKCWAQVQDGVECSVATTDPLGLCKRHRVEILGQRP